MSSVLLGAPVQKRGEKDYDPQQYAVILVHTRHSDLPRLFSDPHGRVVVFDNKLVAQDWMPMLAGDGRFTTWDLTGEYAYFHPLDPDGFNRAVIVTPYPIYDLPPNHPVASETKYREWRHHVMISQWVREYEERVTKGRQDNLKQLVNSLR